MGGMRVPVCMVKQRVFEGEAATVTYRALCVLQLVNSLAGDRMASAVYDSCLSID